MFGDADEIAPDIGAVVAGAEPHRLHDMGLRLLGMAQYGLGEADLGVGEGEIGVERKRLLQFGDRLAPARLVKRRISPRQ